jgi:hypothetical protein
VHSALLNKGFKASKAAQTDAALLLHNFSQSYNGRTVRTHPLSLTGNGSQYLLHEMQRRQ